MSTAIAKQNGSTNRHSAHTGGDDVAREVPVDAEVDDEAAHAGDAQRRRDREALEPERRQRVQRADREAGGDRDGLDRALRERHARAGSTVHAATIARAAAGESSPAAIGRNGLLTRSISTSVSWLTPTIAMLTVRPATSVASRSPTPPARAASAAAISVEADDRERRADERVRPREPPQHDERVGAARAWRATVTRRLAVGARRGAGRRRGAARRRRAAGVIPRASRRTRSRRVSTAAIGMNGGARGRAGDEAARRSAARLAGGSGGRGARARPATGPARA